MAAQASLVNPAIRSSQAEAVRGQILQAEADIVAAKADAERARAQLEEAQANRQDLRVIAPFAGTVATRTAEPGEVVMPGTPIITLVNLSEVYLRAFVPEGQIGRVRIGQPARVYLDSAPTKPIDASVSRIDPEASFTPENTYFREDRVEAGRRREALAPRGRRLRHARHAGGRRDPGRRRGLARPPRAALVSGTESQPDERRQPAAEATQSAAIRVRGLTKRYGAVEAVRCLDLDVAAGEIFGLIGPDAAGKTSTFQILSGVVEASSGTVEENLDFFAGVYGVPPVQGAERKRWVLDFAGLTGRGDQLTGLLPGGWKQRVTFGAAIMHEPRVLFLDEPTSGVDPIARRAFWAAINRLADQGTRSWSPRTTWKRPSSATVWASWCQASS
jgi:ABC-type glutathione transport system ATPase component